MPKTLVDVTFEIEHADDVTDDELHTAMETLKLCIQRDTLDIRQDPHWIGGYLSQRPDGLLAVEPYEVWVKGPC